MIKVIIITIFLVQNIFSFSINDFIDIKKCDKIIDKKVFKICYSYKNKGALAVWYDLDSNLINIKNIKKRPSFYNEKNLKLEYRAKSKDYIKSGFDRGHLANDASFDYDIKILKKTYSMANIIPQYPKINRYTWIKAERYERTITTKLKKITVLNIVNYANNSKKIKNNISVPTSFVKVLFNNKENFSKCFKYENIKDIDIKKDKLKNHLIDCQELFIKEKKSLFDFFKQ